MITSAGLQQLGFTPEDDFILQDDGAGVYIKEWLSASPQPTVEEIEAAEVLWDQAQSDREAAKLSAIQKLATAAGLTADEQTAFFGGQA